MSVLDQLYTQLRQQGPAQAGGTMTLSERQIPGLAGLLGTLQLNDLEIELADPGALSRTPRSIQLLGAVTYNQQRFDARLLVVPPPDQAAIEVGLALTLQLAEDTEVTLGDFFDETFPPTFIADGARITQQASYLDTTVVRNPKLHAANAPGLLSDLGAGGTFEADLLIRGPIKPYQWLVGDGPLPLSGKATKQADRSWSLDLEAPFIGPTLTLPTTAVRTPSLLLRTLPAGDSVFLTDGPTSVLRLGAVLDFGSEQIDVTAGLLEGDFAWNLIFTFENPSHQGNIAAALEAVASFLGIETDLQLPEALVALASFDLTKVNISLEPSQVHGSGLGGIRFLSATIQSTKRWDPPIPFLTVQDAGISLTLQFPGRPDPTYSAQVFGTLDLSDADANPAALAASTTSDGSFRFEVGASFPLFVLSGSLDPETPIQIDQVLGWFGLKIEEPQITVAALDISAQADTQRFEAYAELTTDWAPSLGGISFHLEQVSLWIDASQNDFAGGLSGSLVVYPRGQTTDPFAQLFVAAAHQSDQGWFFQGVLVPGTSVPLRKLAEKYIGSAAAWLPTELEIGTIETSFDTGSKTFTFQGSATARWKPSLFEGDDVDLGITAAADITRRQKSGGADNALPDATVASDPAGSSMVVTGTISGSFFLNRFVVALEVTLTETKPTYLFTITYDSEGVEGTATWVEDGATGAVARLSPPAALLASLPVPPAVRTTNADKGHYVLDFRLLDLTLGDVITYLVRLARPNAQYSLEPPWNFLNKIDLSKFDLRIDPTEKSVALTYAVDIDNAFLSLKTIGVQYTREKGEGKVRMILTGRFLTTSYPAAKPLGWDVVDDPPPSVPGKGSSLIKLRYLGLGQRVTLQGITDPNSVTAVLALLQKQMKPVEKPDENPLSQSSGNQLVFNAASHWLAGLDVTLIDTVSVGIVFNDPFVYGLVVSLAGKRAKSFAGLRFELLYKKVSDDVGVFIVQLKVPNAFRQLQFGVVSVTLPIIGVDIYTNGDFTIDLGFPYNNDFTNSFCVQVFPFIGYGGLYFSKLSSATSNQVPQATNGTFDPVLALGVGLSVGVGKTFDKGPLKAGISVTVEAIFQGVLAWFNPTDAAEESDLFFAFQASVGIVGKLYGSINFVVIQVSVSVEAYARATVVFELYEPTLIELDAGVEVKASLKVLFFTVHFSFHTSVHASFTLGHRSPTPWITAGGTNDRSQVRRLTSARAPRRRSHLETRALTLALRQGGALTWQRLSAHQTLVASGLELDWAPILVYPQGKRSVPVFLVPAFTVANLPARFGTDAPAAAEPDYRIVVQALTQNGIPADAAEIDDTYRRDAATSAAGATEEELPFAVLVEGMLRWSLVAYGLGSGGVAPGGTGADGAVVGSGELADLEALMAQPATAEQGFGWDNLSAFLGANLVLQVSTAPASTTAGGTAPAPISGTFFPMIPTLGWTSEQVPDRDFSTFQPIDETYVELLQTYFAKLAVDASTGAEPSASGNGSSETSATAPETTTQSLATFLFRDYFLMLARSAVNQALELMRAYPLRVTAQDSLTSLAATFPSGSADYTLRAGDSIDHVAAFFGVSTAELQARNPDLPGVLETQGLGGSTPIELGVSPQQVAISTQDAALAQNVTLHLGTLLHPLEAGQTLQTLADFSGGTLDGLFAPISEGQPLATAARLLVAGAALELASLTFDNSGGLDLTTVAATVYVRVHGSDGVPHQPWYAQAIGNLNVGVSLTPLPAEVVVPKQLHDTDQTMTWTTLVGDDLDRVAATLALAQNPGTDAGFQTFLGQVRQLNPTPGTTVKLPTLRPVVEAGDTLSALAARFFYPKVEDLAVVIATQEGLLSAHAVVNIPSVTTTTGAGDTWRSLAARFDLSVEALASIEAVQKATGVYAIPAKDGSVTLTMRDVPWLHVESLVEAVLTGKAVSRISGMVSRFFWQGLRIPTPTEAVATNAATGAPAGLFELSGQQVAGPAPTDGAAGETVAVSLDIETEVEVPWVTLVESDVLQTGESVADVIVRHPESATLNPGLVEDRLLAAGTLLLTAAAKGLTLDITEAQLSSGYPATSLTQPVVKPLAAMRLFDEVPRSYGVQHRITWQAAVPPSLPATAETGTAQPPASGTPSLWLLPEGLTAGISAGGATDEPYELVTVERNAPPTAPRTPVSGYAWASLVRLGLRRVSDPSSGKPLDGVYELAGADPAGRRLLLQLWQFLAAHTGDAIAGTQIALLYPANANDDNPTGLSSDDLDPTATWLLQTNLSTETTNGGVGAAVVQGPPSSGDHYALLDAPQRFLQLAWEASVVGTGGTYLQYRTTGGGVGLPGATFGRDGRGDLYLVVLLPASVANGRELRSFDNCAVVRDNIDPTASMLLAQEAKDPQLVKKANVPAGVVGFDLTLSNPASAPASSQRIAQELYSLLGYQLSDGGGFDASVQGLPLTPLQIDDPDEPLYLRAERRAALALGGQTPTGDGWLYHHAIPIHRFAASPVPSAAPLPDPANDPYAGIGADVTASIDFTFNDLFGNVAVPPADGADASAWRLPVPVGYTDEVVGVDRWPGLTSGFQILPPEAPATQPSLVVSLTLQPATYLPASNQTLEQAQQAAAAHLARYSQIYYQVMQPDLTVSLQTSLSQASGTDAASRADLGGDSLGLPLRTLAAGACTYLDAASQLIATAPNLAQLPTLDDITSATDGYGVTYAEVAEINREVEVTSVFPGPTLNVPRFAIVRHGDTAAAISARLGGTPTPRALLEEPENAGLPLRPGTDLTVEPRTLTVEETTASLGTLASANQCRPGALAASLAAQTGLIVAGATLRFEGLTVVVPENIGAGETVATGTPSFDQLAAQLVTAGANEGTTGTDVAVANQTVDPLFQVGQQVRAIDYVVQAGESLESNGSGTDLSALAAHNTETADLFEAGTPLFVGAEAQDAVGTLEELAETWGVTVEQLLYENRNERLVTDTGLRIPGAADLPSDAIRDEGSTSLRAPYTVSDDDSLRAIAGRFELPGSSGSDKTLALAEINQELPDLLQPGVTIEVGGASLTVEAGNSMAVILQRFQDEHDQTVTLAQLVSSIGERADVLQAEALVLCPLAQASAATTEAARVTGGGGEAVSLADLARVFGLTPALLATGNAALTGILVPGVALTLGDQTVTTIPLDTFNSVLSRFEGQASATLGEIATANATAPLIRSSALLLLPPATPALSTTFAPRFPAPVFPLAATLTLTRDASWVNPNFRATGGQSPTASEQARASLAPRATRKTGLAGGSADPAPRSLDQFARDLQSALPQLRVATAGADSPTETGGDQQSRAWAVHFGKGGIESVQVAPGTSYTPPTSTGGSGSAPTPRAGFFALQPVATKLQSGSVEVRELKSDGTLGSTKTLDLRSVDLEVWASAFLADVDRLLSPAYAMPLRQLDDGAALRALDQLADTKKELAAAIVEGVDYALRPTARDAEALQAAQEALRQNLLIHLREGYSTSVILQFAASVDSAFSGSSAGANLSGQAQIQAARAQARRTGVPWLQPATAAVTTPEVTLSTAKTSLLDGSSYVNFLLRLANEDEHENITLDLDYSINEMEFDVESVPDTEGYTSSRWLTFVLPLDDAADLPPGVDLDLGQVEIPIPLRAYPETPRLTAQRSQATTARPSTIPEAKQWDFLFTYENRFAAQDRVRLSAQLNVPAEGVGDQPLTGSSPTLLEALARYTTVSAALWKILAGLPAVTTTTSNPTLANAVETFGALAEQVAGAWGRHWARNVSSAARAAGSGPAQQTYVYDADLVVETDAGSQPSAWYQTLDLLFDAGQGWPGSGAPAITCITPDGERVELATPKLSAGRASYAFPTSPRVPAFTELSFAFTFPGLDVVAQQNGAAKVAVLRNTDLVDFGITASGFLYQTPAVAFATPTTPDLVASKEIPLDASLDLQAAIERALRTVLADADGNPTSGAALAAAGQYGFLLRAGTGTDSTSLISYLPVLFKPRFDYAPSVARELAHALTTWQATQEPQQEGGRWALSVLVYSGIENAPERPLLDLQRLVYVLSADPA